MSRVLGSGWQDLVLSLDGGAFSGAGPVPLVLPQTLSVKEAGMSLAMRRWAAVLGDLV